MFDSVINIISSITIGLVFGIGGVWVWFAHRADKLETTMQLQTQILNNQQPILRQIYDDSRATHAVTGRTHERIGNIENILACQSEEHASHERGLGEIKQILR